MCTISEIITCWPCLGRTFLGVWNFFCSVFLFWMIECGAAVAIRNNHVLNVWAGVLLSSDSQRLTLCAWYIKSMPQ